jgi:hypothetical protein
MIGFLNMIVVALPKTRKGAKKLMAVITCLCIAVAAIVFVFWSADQRKLEEIGQPSFNTLPMEQLESGLIVQGTIDTAIAAYAEAYDEYLHQKEMRISTNLYYLIPVFSVNDEGWLVSYFITFEAAPNDFEIMRSIEAQTWNEVITMTELPIDNAVIYTLHDDYKEYLQEWVDDSFYEGGSFIDWCVEYNILGTSDPQTIRSRLVPYLIRQTAAAGTNLTVAWVFLGIAGFALIILLLLILRKTPIKGLDHRHDKQFDQVRDMMNDD